MRALLSLEGKQRLVEKVLSRKGKSIAEIAKENNVGYSTLQKWVRYSGCGKLVGGSVTVKTGICQESCRLAF